MQFKRQSCSLDERVKTSQNKGQRNKLEAKPLNIVYMVLGNIQSYEYRNI